MYVGNIRQQACWQPKYTYDGLTINLYITVINYVNVNGISSSYRHWLRSDLCSVSNLRARNINPTQLRGKKK